MPEFWPFPYVNIYNYGARAGAQIASGCSVSTSVGVTKVSYGPSTFTAADAGKSIQVVGAGSAPTFTPSPPQATLAAQIQSVSATSTNSVATLSIAASANPASTTVVWGTDNSSPLQVAANACPSPAAGATTPAITVST
jgi:hypothetical protein